MFYFADDDNTYDRRLFNLIRSEVQKVNILSTSYFLHRQTRAVSVFPVGLVGKFGLSSPVIFRGALSSFYDSYDSGRTFKLDMAGFAVNLEYFRSDRYLKNVQNDMMYFYYKRLFLEVCPRLKT